MGQYESKLDQRCLRLPSALADCQSFEIREPQIKLRSYLLLTLADHFDWMSLACALMFLENLQGLGLRF